MSFPDTIAAWHDFYITAGTASATLVGLLFVGISLHVRIVATHVDVRRLARVTLSTFVAVVMISLIMLVPTDRAAVTGVYVTWASLVSLVLIIPSALEALRTERRRALSRTVLLSRFVLVLLTFVGASVAGIVLTNGDLVDAFNLLFGAVLLMLVVSVRNTWELLVTLASK